MDRARPHAAVVPAARPLASASTSAQPRSPPTTGYKRPRVVRGQVNARLPKIDLRGTLPRAEECVFRSAEEVSGALAGQSGDPRPLTPSAGPSPPLSARAAR